MVDGWWGAGVVAGALVVTGLLIRAFAIGKARGEHQPLLAPVGARAVHAVHAVHAVPPGSAVGEGDGEAD